MTQLLYPIMNPPSVPYAVLVANTPDRATDWFRKALVALWDVGITTGVDPVVLAGQCAHETGWGGFGGAVTPDMGNTCGLKTRNASGDTKDDHASFPMLDGYPFVGAVAHAHHLRLYAGFVVDLASTPDPRADWVQPGTTNFGSCMYVQELGGRWAPSSSYGNSVAETIQALSGWTAE